MALNSLSLGLLNTAKPGIGAGGGAPAYDADAAAYWARGATTPTDTQKQKLSDFVAALKSAGVWSLMDVIHLYAAPYSDIAPLNMKGTSYSAVPTNSPTWTAGTGYATNGSTSYIDAGFQFGTNFTQNNASFGVLFTADVPGTTSYPVGIDGSGPTKLFQYGGTSPPYLNWRINTTSSAQTNNPARHGFFQFARQVSNQAEFSTDGAASVVQASTSSAPGANNFLIGRHAGNYIAVTCPLFYAGGYLTDTQKAAFNSAIVAYRS